MYITYILYCVSQVLGGRSSQKITPRPHKLGISFRSQLGSAPGTVTDLSDLPIASPNDMVIALYTCPYTASVEAITRHREMLLE